MSSLRDYRMGLLFAGSNVFTWSLALGTPMVLLGEYLGASAPQIGILYSFLFFLAPLQVFATLLIPRFGYKKLAIASWGGRTFLLLIPAAAALHASSGATTIHLNAFMLAIFVFCLIRTVGMTALFPWIMEWIPDSIRTRYYATESIAMSVVGVLSLILSSVTLAILPSGVAYALLYGVAAFGGCLSTYALFRIPEVVPASSIRSFGEMLRKLVRVCGTPSKLRQYLIFNLCFGICHFAFIPFTTYYLRVDAGLEDSYILMLSVIGFSSMAVGSVYIRKIMPAIGILNGLHIWTIVNVFMGIYWLLLVLGIPGVIDFLPLQHVLGGIAAASYICAHMTYLAHVSNETDRAFELSVFNAVTGFLGGISPIVWGWFLKAPEGGAPGINQGAFTFFFVAFIAIFVCLPLAIRKFEHPDGDKPVLFQASMLLRPHRFFATIIQIRDEAEKAPKEGSEGGP